MNNKDNVVMGSNILINTISNSSSNKEKSWSSPPHPHTKLARLFYLFFVSFISFNTLSWSINTISTLTSTYLNDSTPFFLNSSPTPSNMNPKKPSSLSSSSSSGSLFSKIKKAYFDSSSSLDSGKGKSKSKSTNRKVSHGFNLVKGKSGHDMEDYHVAEYRNKKGHMLGLFAIFDGHLGDRVPSYLRDNLFDNILREASFWKDPESAIKNAYRATDNLILQNSGQLGPGGSTAVTAIVIDGKDLWVANIDDSKGVLCESGAANQITVDHEPHTERKRIEKQGGFVTQFPGDVPRVNGQLAVACAFCDQSLKAHLSSEPDVRHVPVDPSTEFVILASDSLWKVMSNEEAIDLVRAIKDPKAAAKRLTTEALGRKSKDDISCIVIRFG